MRSKDVLPALSVLLLMSTVGCQAREPENQPAATSPAATAAPATTPPPAVEAAVTTASQAAPATAAPTTAPPPAAALASQQTNWPGIVAEVTEFRRKGSTLTVKVVLRNQGNVESEPRVAYDELYVMDLGAGKKYEVLKDEKGNYIAALRSGYRDLWFQKLQPGETYTIWVKLPAPPPDVKTVTLQIPGVPPFEDLAIQDS